VNTNKARGRNFAFEVPVISGTPNGGLIDAVEITEHTIARKDLPSIRTCFWDQDDRSKTKKNLAELGCIRGHAYAVFGCDVEECRWNCLTSLIEDVVNVYCYEIKVTKADFMSKNGHNFVGNYNYYVIPLNLYHEVKDLIPPDIGVIASSRTIHNWGNGERTNTTLRRKKDAEYKDIGHEAQKWLILSVFKRMRKTGNFHD